MNNKLHKTDIAIIGAGPVGLFSVFQAGMLSMSSIVIDSLDVIGGQCSTLYPEKPIYDIPAHPEITGQGLIDALKKQASPFKPKYLLGRSVSSINQEGKVDKRYKIILSDNTIVSCKVIFIASGCGAFIPNKPPIDNLSLYEDKSFFFKVDDKERFRNKNLLILGGGDSAVDWAINLSEIASQVTIVHRRDKFRALPSSVERMRELSEAGKINIITHYHLKSLKGRDGLLTDVSLSTLDGKNLEISVDYALAFYGIKSNLGAIMQWGLKMNDYKKIIVEHSSMLSNKNNVYAIGDAAYYLSLIHI